VDPSSAPPPHPPLPHPEKSRALLAAVLAILAFFLCAFAPLAALPAYWLAGGELRGIEAGRRSASWRPLAKVVRLLSGVTLAVWVALSALQIYVLVAQPEWAQDTDDHDWFDD